jgi:hypothetical protein
MLSRDDCCVKQWQDRDSVPLLLSTYLSGAEVKIRIKLMNHWSILVDREEPYLVGGPTDDKDRINDNTQPDPIVELVRGRGGSRRRCGSRRPDAFGARRLLHRRCGGCHQDGTNNEARWTVVASFENSCSTASSSGNWKWSVTERPKPNKRNAKIQV